MKPHSPPGTPLLPAAPPAPPRSEAELEARLGRIAGHTLGELAAAAGVEVPAELRRAKGWAGALLERTLGATAGSHAGPDFPALGVELKSLPVDPRGQPLESTFVTSLDLAAPPGWLASPVREKLARVAWVPLQGARGLPLAERRVGTGLLWSPSAEEETGLRRDYEEIVELIEAGFGARVTGHRGVFLQLRPKGARASSLRWAVDEEGAPARTAPRAFYLRPAFTSALLRRHFVY